MADEVLSTSENTTGYPSRVPLPDEISPTSSILDRSSRLVDTEHTRSSSLGALEHVRFASSVPLPGRNSWSSSRPNRSAEIEDVRHTRHSSLDALERAPFVLSETAPSAPATFTPVQSPAQHGSPLGDTTWYEKSANSMTGESIGSNVPNDSDQAALPSFAGKVRELQLCLLSTFILEYARPPLYTKSRGFAIQKFPT